MNYHPSAWERIGGPWAITLRAYLWTAPIAVLFQPIIELGFWSGEESPFAWLLVCSLGYLALGAFLYVANRFVIPNRDIRAAPWFVIALIGISAGIIRSFVIGTLIPIFGLSGINAQERMPFGAIIGLFWIITSSLIMDTKYRYRKQLDELIAEQIPLIEQQRANLTIFGQSILSSDKSDLDRANFRLQNSFRDVITKMDSSGSNWEPVARQALRNILNLINVPTRPRRFSELEESEYIVSRREAFRIISRTPLFHIPVVFSFYVTLIFLAAARILPIDEAIAELTVGLLVNLLILVISKRIIQRSDGNSSFGYLVMIAVLILQAIIGPLFSTASYISIFVLQVFALAGTMIEIIWIVATGLLLLSQQNRQKIIDQATFENDLLQRKKIHWESIASSVTAQNISVSATLERISNDIQSFIETDQPERCIGAIECASTLLAEIKFIRKSIDVFSIETELERIVATYANEAKILWTVSGEPGTEANLRSALALIELSIFDSLQNSGANVISIDLKSSTVHSEVTISDNGYEFSESPTIFASGIMQEISKNTWTKMRAGGVNKVTAKIG